MRARLSQRQLAFDGCSPAYISRIEAGQRTPSLQLLRELGRLLGVSADYLATGEEPAAPGPAEDSLTDAEVALRLDETDEAERLYRRQLERTHDPAVRARSLEGLGQVALRRGQPARAVELFEEALEVAGVRDASELPSLAASLAYSYASLGELARSIAILERCVERYERDPVQYVRFAGLLGAALTDSGSFAEAERVLAAALARGRDLADPYVRSRLLWSEYRLHAEQGNTRLAERYAKQALATLRTTEDTHSTARLMQGLAQVYLDQNRPAEALELLREGWPLLQPVATPLEAAQFRIEEARALAALGETERAGALAMEISLQLQGTHAVDSGRVYALLAEIYWQLDEPARARELLELAIELLERQGPTRYLVNAYKRLAELLKQRGETEAAFELLERALGVQDTAGRRLS